jgi:hypothetical protein
MKTIKPRRFVAVKEGKAGFAVICDGCGHEIAEGQFVQRQPRRRRALTNHEACHVGTMYPVVALVYFCETCKK